MKKSLIALAVAGAIAAPAAMADATIYGKISVDFINETAGTGAARDEESGVQADDVIFGIKASSETDSGLMVSGEIQTEGDFGAGVTLAYIKVGTESTNLWAGKFGNPADAYDVPAFSDTSLNGLNGGGNGGHFPGELASAVAVSYAANGLTAAVGSVQAQPTSNVGSFNATTGVPQVTSSDSDGFAAALGYSAAGFSAGVGYQTADGTLDTTGFKVGYSADGLTASLHYVSTEYVATTSSDVDSTYGMISYTMGNTTVAGIIGQDDYSARTGASARAAGEDDLYAVKVAQNLGGGLSAYVEYSNIDGDITDDLNTAVVGMAYSF